MADSHWGWEVRVCEKVIEPMDRKALEKELEWEEVKWGTWNWDYGGDTVTHYVKVWGVAMRIDSVCNRKTTERESISELGDENIIQITLTDTAATKTSDKSSVKESDTEPKIKILNCWVGIIL